MTKKRIIKYLEIKGIKKPEFFKKTGIKRGFLDSDKMDATVSDFHLKKIKEIYPEINITWLITGIGNMISTEIRPTNGEVMPASDTHTEIEAPTVSSRIMKYLNSKEISKYKFYKETGLSNGMLDKSGNLGSDKCEIVLLHYPDLSPEWLITGRGNMLQDKLHSKAETEDLNNVASNIRRLVENEFNGNVTKFAAEVGISETNVRNYIGGRVPKLEILKQIVDTFNLSYDEFIRGNIATYIKGSDHRVNIIQMLIQQIADKDTLILSQHEEIKELMRENAELKQTKYEERKQ